MKLTITAQNYVGDTSKTFMVTVKEKPVKPTIKTQAIPGGYVNEAYYESPKATGTAPITWSATGLPPGLSCNPNTGEISGTPNQAGEFKIALKATNSAGSDSVYLPIPILADIPRITTSSLPDGYYGKAYSAKITAKGATPITFIVSNLPKGLSCNSSTGAITGTPTRTGTFNVSLGASNSFGRAATRIVPLTIIETGIVINPPSITTTSLPQGKAGEAYSATLTATGTTPITWSASGLPSGLSCSSAGKITGTPTSSGIFSVKVTASNTIGSVSKTLQLIISSATDSTELDEYDVRPEFKTHSLMLDGQIGVNFYMLLPEISGIDYNNGKDCYMTFGVKNDYSVNVPQIFDAEFMNSSKKYYGFRCFINSIQMADPIKATFTYGGKSTVTHEYSVKEYLDTAISKTSVEAEKVLMQAIKDYGHYAQLNLARLHGWTIGNEHLAMDCTHEYSASDIEKVRAAVDGYEIVRNTANSGIEKASFSLNLDSDTVINIYLKPYSSYTGSVAAYLEGNKENIAVKQPDGRYKIEISSIAAHLLGKTYTITVNARESFIIKVSALSYVRTVLNASSAKDEEKKNCAALYKYYEATMAYRKYKGYKD